MGKRVTVTKPQVPKVRVDRLRHPGEVQARQLGLLLPGMIYVGVIGVGLAVLPKMAYFMLGWLAVGWFFLTALASAQKGKQLKGNSRNKVAGTAYPELRLTIHRLCKLMDIKNPPDTYVIEAPQLVGMVRGLTGPPYMLISSRMLALLSPLELEAELATMLGHIKARNVRWRTFLHVLLDGGGLIRFLAWPYTLIALLAKPFLDYSHSTADILALLSVDGDARLVSRTILKVIARSSEALDEEQAGRLEAFLDKPGVEARAEDVELQYLLGHMTRTIPWLQERLEFIKQATGEKAFGEALAAVHERRETLQLARG